jgi:threonine/homoserine/homoserine lactone efflux protein
MQMADAIFKGILLGLFMAISVGPTLFAIINYSLHFSYKAGIAFVLGVSLSDIMYVTIANTAANWLSYLKVYERYLAYGGGAILIVVGLVGIFGKNKPTQVTEQKLAIRKMDYFRIWGSGFLINTINPGVIISWLAAVTATVSSSGYYRFVLFGTCLGLILSIDFTKVFLADLIRKSLNPKRIRYLQIFSSVCLLFIGIMLLAGTAYKASH